MFLIHYGSSGADQVVLHGDDLLPLLLWKLHFLSTNRVMHRLVHPDHREAISGRSLLSCSAHPAQKHHEGL